MKILLTVKTFFIGMVLIIGFSLTARCQVAVKKSTLLIHGGKIVKNSRQWEGKRDAILRGMQDAMGDLPDRRSPEAPTMIVRDSLGESAYTRLTISLVAAPGESVPAYLYIPATASQSRKSAAMLVLHGTGDGGKKLVDGESPLANRALAKELAERGYVVIAPDYPSMGELKDYDFENDRYQSGTMKAIFNHMRCVDFLQTLPAVDDSRIGVIGHSLGGHNAMFVAAFDRRLKVVVASCGWTLMDYYDIGEEASRRYGGRLGPWAQERYMPWLRDKYDLNPEKIPFDFDEVIATLAPRAFFSNSPVRDANFDVKGVEAGIASALEVYNLLGAGANLQVRYPDAAHDFPAEIRSQAYAFIDKVLQHSPNPQSIK